MSELRDVEAIRADLAAMYSVPHFDRWQYVVDRLSKDVEPLLDALAAAEARADEWEKAYQVALDADPSLRVAANAVAALQRMERAEQQLRQVREQVAAVCAQYRGWTGGSGPIIDRLAALSPSTSPTEDDPPTFNQLLSDPTEQFDRRSELLPHVLTYLGVAEPDDRAAALMRSIEEYRHAPSNTASAPRYVPPSPTEDEPSERAASAIADLMLADADARGLPTSPEQYEQRQCKHGNTEPHYLRFTTGTTARCPGPISLEQQRRDESLDGALDNMPTDDEQHALDYGEF